MTLRNPDGISRVSHAMIRNRASLMFIAAALIVLGMGGVSFVRPFTGNIAPTARTWLQLVVVEGNIRTIFARGSEGLSEPAGAESAGLQAIDEVKLFWQRALFVAVPLRLRTYHCEDPTDTRFGTWEVRLDLSAFILGPFLLLFAWFVGPGRHLFAHLPGVFREIWKPSDGKAFWPASRLFRRTVVGAVMGIAGVSLAFLMLAVVESGQSGSLYVWHPSLFGERVHSVSVEGGSLSVEIKADPNAVGKGNSTKLPGLHLDTKVGSILRSELPPFIVKGNPSDPGYQAAMQKLMLNLPRRTTVHRVRLDLWVPLILFAWYPVLALIRGPIRRYRRRLHGHCLRCGYSLTGLIEPRCPECGSPFNPDDARAIAGAGQDESERIWAAESGT